MQKAIYVIDLTLKTIMVVLFVLMLGITTVNVIMRFCFSAPIPSAVEMGRFCFVGIIYLGAIYVMKEKGHIGLDIFVDKLPRVPRRIVSLIGQVLVIVFLFIFSFEAIQMVANSGTVKSSSLGISMSIPYSAMVIGGIGMIVEAVVNFIAFIKEKDDDKQQEI